VARSDRKRTFWTTLKLAWELGYTITIPLVGLAILGRLLDRKLGTGPWLLIISILFSIVISSLAIYLKVIRVLKNFEKEIKKK
jgi:F0F1-type ATP synthase assembly protein I